jgi:hypothetical protein
MTHGRRGLTVLSLLIILIVVALIVFILLRASNRAGDAPPLGDDPSAIPAESVESATLTSIRAPQSNVSPGDSDTLTVRLTNSAGTPFVGVTVRFEITEGGGSVEPDTVRVDDLGTANAVWTYGSTPGTNSIRISADVPNVRVEPLLFSVQTSRSEVP